MSLTRQDFGPEGEEPRLTILIEGGGRVRMARPNWLGRLFLKTRCGRRAFAGEYLRIKRLQRESFERLVQRFGGVTETRLNSVERPKR